jgi:HYR domain-containing protein
MRIAKVAAVPIVLAGMLLGAAGAAGPPNLETPAIQAGPGTDGSLPGWTQEKGGTFTFVNNDLDHPSVTFQCRLDGGQWIVCTSPYDLPTPPAPLSDGEHDFEVRVILGDPDDGRSRSAHWQWTVDSTPPSIPSDQSAEATSAAGAAVSFHTSDALDPEPQLDCSPQSGGTFALGQTQVSCTATDHAGNQVQGTFELSVVDTTPPVLASHANVTAEQTSAAGGVAVYNVPSATDLVDPAPSVACLPQSGAFFDPGKTTVTCTASDSSGNDSQSTFTVTLADTTPPLLDPHNDVPAEQASPSGTVVEYELPTATDAVDQAPSVSCAPVSGSLFTPGDTTVTCTASDSSGNDGTSTFVVQVADTVPPVLGPHGDVPFSQTSADGAVVNFAYPAGSVTDAADPNPTVDCDPESGSLFPFGSTTVTCTATDASGNVSEPDEFDVLVQEGELPPKPSIVSSVPSITNQTTVKFTFSADPDSTLDCRLEGPGQGGVFEECDSSTEQSYSSLSDGRYLFTLRVKSSIGNVNQGTRTLTIDTAPPASVGAFRTRSGDGRVKLSWTQPVDLGYDHVLVNRKRAGGSSWKKIGIRRDASTLVDSTPSNEVRYVYGIRSVDKAGNVSAMSTAAARPSKILSPQFDAIVGSAPLVDWVGSLHASYYNLQLWRNGKKILSVWPVKSAFRVRSSWSFNGRRYALGSDAYRVYVWPGFGPKYAADYGSLLGWSQFSVK